MNEIKSIVESLDKLTRSKREIEREIKIAAKDQYKKLEQLCKRQEMLESEENMLRAEIRESAGFLTRQHDEVSDDIQSTTARLKRAIHQLPAESISGGAKLDGDNISVTVSKTQVTVAYRSSMLSDYPWMSNHVLADGTSVIEPVIKPSAIEELIRDGRLSEDQIREYKVITKVRSPSVRITSKEK